MNFVRLLAHGSGRSASTLGPGRPGSQYSSSAGTIIDIPENSHDTNTLTANGWSKVGYVGTTAQRPSGVNAGTPYVDTTLSKIVVFDGVSWRDPSNGNTV